MTETTKRPLFRPEAVEHHLRGLRPNRTLDLKERRTVWLFRALLAAVAVALVLAATITVETHATGAVTVGEDGRHAVTLLRGVPEGAPARVTVGEREVAARVEPRQESDEAGVVRLLLAEPLRRGDDGTVRIELGRTSILRLLLGRD